MLDAFSRQQILCPCLSASGEVEFRSCHPFAHLALQQSHPSVLGENVDDDQQVLHPSIPTFQQLHLQIGHPMPVDAEEQDG